jgi:TP901 family phage tail tape measure protein
VADEIKVKVTVTEDQLTAVLTKQEKLALNAESAMKAFNNAVKNGKDPANQLGKSIESMFSSFKGASVGISALTNIKKPLEDAKKPVSDLSRLFGEMNNQLSLVKATFVGTFAANLVAKSLSAISGGFRDAIQSTREFSRAIAEINSTLPANSKLTDEQAKRLATLSEKFGTSAASQARGFFEAVSNGVEDTAVAFNILSAANNAALSGLVDINTATRLITTTFNAYKAQGVSVAQITDSLVSVTQLSGAKFEELAQSMGRVTNVAAQSGISISELGGTVAFLNARSLTTEQAITGIAGAIGDISKPTKEAAAEAARLGIEFNATALKSKGLVGFLQDVTEKTNGNITSLRTLFGDQRSANAVVAIATSKFKEYADTVDKVAASQGEAARAAKTIKESLDFKLDQLSNQFNGLAIAIGSKLTPLIEAATNAIIGLKQVLGESGVSVDENVNKIKKLGEEYNGNVDKVKRLTKELESFKAIGADGSAAIAQEQLNKTLERQNQILAERQRLRTKAPVDAPAGTDPTTPEPRQVEAEKLERESLNRIAVLRAEFNQSQAQIKLDQQTQLGVLQQDELARVIEAENALINAKYAAELEKTKLIQDAATQRAAIEEIDLKKRNDRQKNQDNRDKAAFSAKIALERNLQQQRGQIIGQGFALASELAKDGSKTQFLIQKAGALAQIGIARGLAIAAVPSQVAAIPYPANLAAAAQLTAYANIQAALGAATVAASAIKGFATGGIVGDGASTGGDNTVIKARKGEMVLNAEEQKSLFDAIRTGSFGVGDIVVQIDGREIARATRNQIRSGFVLA